MCLDLCFFHGVGACACGLDVAIRAMQAGFAARGRRGSLCKIELQMQHGFTIYFAGIH